MRNWLYMFLCCGMISSCQFFDTEKISSETFYQEKLKRIDWECVDQYPAFKSCEQLTEKQQQKICFETKVGAHIYQFIGAKKIITTRDLNDTVSVVFGISNAGKVVTKDIKIDSVLLQTIPMLEEWLKQSIDALPKSQPAYKRGIPVETEFTLPVIISTQPTIN